MDEARELAPELCGAFVRYFTGELLEEESKTARMEISKGEIEVIVHHWIEQLYQACGWSARDVQTAELHVKPYGAKRIRSFLEAGMISVGQINQMAKEVFTDPPIYQYCWTDLKESEYSSSDIDNRNNSPAAGKGKYTRACSQDLDPLVSKGFTVGFVDEIHGDSGKSKEVEVSRYEIRVVARHWIRELYEIHGSYSEGCVGSGDMRLRSYADRRVFQFLEARMIKAVDVNKMAKEIYRCQDVYKDYWRDWREPEEWDEEDAPPEARAT